MTCALGGLLQHVVTVPARDGHEGNGFGVIADLLDEGRCLLDNFIEPILAPLEMKRLAKKSRSNANDTNLGGVHLVDGNDKLPDTKSEGKESVLAGLAILRDTSLELTSATGDDKNGTISLGGTSNHVFDEVTVTGGINNLAAMD